MKLYQKIKCLIFPIIKKRKIGGTKMTDSRRIHPAQSWWLAPIMLLLAAFWMPIVDADARGPMASPEISVNRSNLYFGAVVDGGNTSSATTPQRLLIANSGGGALNWTVTPNGDWIICTPTFGTNSGAVTLSVASCGLPVGAYNGTITISAPGATNSPQTVSVGLDVKAPAQNQPPFGGFDTPIQGATVRGSVPVTGWVLDDVGVDYVKIYNGGTYLGDATFVEGARPDAELANPAYPASYQAGWGYMLLTNFLPGGGKGVYKLHAVATDSEGQQTTLGSKTIYCDNANAVKPFGAIDTPTQGGTASGSEFVNRGWALTPQPNTIPSDGSTINVYVDGINRGHPSYNMYSADIASVFPGYNNSNGAAGVFYLDTTKYADGVHAIQWTATDNADNTDGIGSRYFTIRNEGRSTVKSNGVAGKSFSRAGAFDEIPTDYTVPVQYRTGYDESAPLLDISPDSVGAMYVSIRESDRVEVHLNETGFTGYSPNGDLAGPLPIGSTLDTSGTFHWIPGPGFMGTFELIFVRGDVVKTKKVLKVTIRPKQAPFPGITANGQKGVVSVSSGAPVLLSVSLSPSNYAGQGADWWVAALTPGVQWKYFDLSTGTFVEGLATTHQGALFTLGDSGLASLTNLSAGTHNFFFGVDMLQNGLPDMDQIYYDSVTVVVTP
jgi:hypothetical protein